jgi:hypothetical protein
MRHTMRCVTWRDRSFRFQRMPARWAEDTLEWSVSCGLEFIGTMACAVSVTTGEFEVRCRGWLDELLR